MNRHILMLCCLTAVMPNLLHASEPTATTSETPSESTCTAETVSKLDAIIARLPKISGYLQTGWDYNSLGAGTSTFQVKRLRLLMDGTITPKASFRLQIEAFSNTPAHANGQKSLQVMDAYATYHFSSAFQVRAGQYNSPMCYENYNISPATMETVDFSLLCSRMIFRNAIGYGYPDFGRDLGVMVMGSLFPTGDGFSRLAYNLSLVNGHLPSINDNNKSKEVQAVTSFRPQKYFDVKIAYSYGEYTGDRNIDGHKYQPMSRIIGGLWYNNPTGADIRAEYAFATASHDGQHIVKENAFYVLAAYHLGHFLPVLRYELYRDGIDRTQLSANCDKYLAGLTYSPCRNIRLQANYTLTAYTSKVKAANDGHSTSSSVQLMGIFSF